MDRLLARLERRIGGLAIPRLPLLISVVSALVFAAGMTRPEFVALLRLSPARLMAGEIWRAITWVFIPPNASIIWTAIGLLFYASIGGSLEEAWGSFKLTVYYLVGVAATVAAALIAGLPMSSLYLHTTIVFAFATVFPDAEFRLYFIIPIRAKWSALITAGLLGYAFFDGSSAERIAIGIAIANYFLFFAGHLVGLARGVALQERQRQRRGAFERTRDDRPKRSCKICGLTDDDPDADLRVCTCQEVCGGKATVYCLEHARSHNRPA